MSIPIDDDRWQQWADLTQALFEEHPDRIPKAAFDALVQNLPYNAVEVLPYVYLDKGCSVLVVPRNDSEFGSCWAPTGCVAMPCEPLEHVLQRVIQSELGWLQPKSTDAIGVTHIIRPRGQRRNGTAFIYAAEYSRENIDQLVSLSGGTLFPVWPYIEKPDDGRRVQHPEYWEVLRGFISRRFNYRIPNIDLLIGRAKS